MPCWGAGPGLSVERNRRGVRALRAARQKAGRSATPGLGEVLEPHRHPPLGLDQVQSLPGCTAQSGAHLANSRHNFQQTMLYATPEFVSAVIASHCGV